MSLSISPFPAPHCDDSTMFSPVDAPLLSSVIIAAIAYLLASKKLQSPTPNQSPHRPNVSPPLIPPNTPHPLSPLSHSFASWFQSNGGLIDPCLSYETNHETNGLFATHCTISHSSSLLLVPPNLVLSASTASTIDPNTRLARQHIMHAIPNTPKATSTTSDFNFPLSILSIFLCLNGPNTTSPPHFFTPYTDTLPISVCQTPVCNENRTENLLRHTVAFERALQKKRKSLLRYLAASEADVTPTDFLKAVSVVESRAWPPGLLPGIDLLNHDGGGNLVEFNPGDKSNFVLNGRFTEVGEEVFDSYSDVSTTLTMYQNYGFLPAGGAGGGDTCVDLIHLRKHPDQERRKNCLKLAVGRVLKFRGGEGGGGGEEWEEEWEEEKWIAREVGDRHLLDAMLEWESRK